MFYEGCLTRNTKVLEDENTMNKNKNYLYIFVRFSGTL